MAEYVERIIYDADISDVRAKLEELSRETDSVGDEQVKKNTEVRNSWRGFIKEMNLAKKTALASSVAISGAAAAISGGWALAAVGIAGAVGGIGVAVAAQNAEVQADYKDLWEQIKSTTKAGVAPLVPVLIDFADEAKETFSSITPAIDDMFASIAPAVDAFGQGLLDGIEVIVPALDTFVKAGAPLLTMFGHELPGLMGSFGNILTDVAGALNDVGEESLGNLMSGLDDLLDAFGKLFGILTRLGAPILGNLLSSLASLVDTFSTVLGAIGPVLVPVSQLVSDLASMSSTITDLLAPALGVLGPALAVGGAWVLFGGQVRSAITALSDFRAMAAKVGPAAKLGLIVAGAEAAGAGIHYLTQELHEAIPALDHIVGPLNEVSTAAADLTHVTTSVGIQSMVDDITLLDNSLSENGSIGAKIGDVAHGITNFFHITSGGTATQNGIKNATANIKKYDQELADIVSSGHGKKAAALFNGLTSALGRQGKSASDVAALFPHYENALAGAKAAAQQQQAALRGLTSDQDAHNAAVQTAISSVNQFLSSLQTLYGWLNGTQDAEAGVTLSLASLTKALKTNGATLDLNTVAGAKNEQAVSRVTSSILSAVAANYKHTGSVQDATLVGIAHVNQLRSVLKQSGMTKQAIDDYIASLHLTPKDIETAVKTSGTQTAQKQIDNLNVGLGLVKKGAHGSVSVSTGDAVSKINHVIDLMNRVRGLWGGGKLVRISPPAPQHHATGGFLPEGLSIINELGPELLRKRGSEVEVLTAPTTARMLAPTGASGHLTQVTVSVAPGAVQINGNADVAAIERAGDTFGESLRRKLMKL